ncbi:hypothetical protein HY045_03750, partial [Candidatus Woesebacteria bacterium]|nr:hypothetical protein [Candidatus Woesebacteria bacterium]
NGKYEILTDKEGFEFDPINFDASGTIIPPIAIKARRTLAPQIPSPTVHNTNFNYQTPA